MYEMCEKVHVKRKKRFDSESGVFLQISRCVHATEGQKESPSPQVDGIDLGETIEKVQREK